MSVHSIKFKCNGIQNENVRNGYLTKNECNLRNIRNSSEIENSSKSEAIFSHNVENSSKSEAISSHNVENENLNSQKNGTKPKITKLGSKKLFGIENMPLHLQFNPYICAGYRPLLSAKESMDSLFYLHNETVNILTHGIPMLYILLRWHYLIPWNLINVQILPWTHLTSTVSPWIGSTLYHLFMNHRNGKNLYKCLLHLDMFGIWITQSFGALTTVYTSVFCLGVFWIRSVLCLYSFVCIWCLYKAFNARNAWDRRFCYTLPFLMRLASISLRFTSVGGGHPDSIVHIILQDLIAIIGGVVGALRIPEKWIPGRLDFLANSHHIMHVLVVYAVYHLHQGAVLDMIWLSDNNFCR